MLVTDNDIKRAVMYDNHTDTFNPMFDLNRLLLSDSAVKTVDEFLKFSS